MREDGRLCFSEMKSSSCVVARGHEGRLCMKTAPSIQLWKRSSGTVCIPANSNLQPFLGWLQSLSFSWRTAKRWKRCGSPALLSQTVRATQSVLTGAVDFFKVYPYIVIHTHSTRMPADLFKWNLGEELPLWSSSRKINTRDWLQGPAPTATKISSPSHKMLGPLARIHRCRTHRNEGPTVIYQLFILWKWSHLIFTKIKRQS